MVRKLVDTALRRLARSALRRGFSGEGVAWLALAGVAYVLQRARRPDDASVTMELRPGDRYLVSLVEPGGGSAKDRPSPEG